MILYIHGKTFVDRFVYVCVFACIHHEIFLKTMMTEKNYYLLNFSLYFHFYLDKYSCFIQQILLSKIEPTGIEFV